MADLWDYRQRWRRRRRRWRRWVDDRLEAWRRWVQRTSNVFEVSEVTMDVQQETEQAMARAIREQMGAHTARVLKESIREECLAELREEALQLARQELEEEFSRRQERLQDDMARYKAKLEEEMLGELDRQRDALRQEIRDELEERLATLTDERNGARAERDRAERVVLALLTQLLPEGKRTYLHSAGVRELDRWAANEVLARYGLQVKSRPSYSERLVKTRLDQERHAAHTQFWLEPYAPAEPVDPATGIPLKHIVRPT
jgi:hypothetical protein